MIVILGIIATVSIGSLRAGYESARYKVVKSDGKFEIRKYQPHVVVSTSMQAAEGGGSFGRLFKYISGNNKTEKKIAMTTPVFMPATSEGKATEMQFVVPEDIAKAGAPVPAGSSVRLDRMSGGDYVVLRYSGRNSESSQKKQLAALRKEVKDRSLSTSGNPIFAGYDPPWTPGPMRRNEVLLKLD